MNKKIKDLERAKELKDIALFKEFQEHAFALATKSEKKALENIYKLQLHEKIEGDGLQITKVASGWIYRFLDYKQSEYSNGVFIPFDNEFQSKGNYDSR